MSDEGGIETELSRGRRIDKERDGARGERGEKSEPCIQRGYRERLRKEEGGQIYRQKGEKMENRTGEENDGVYGEIEEMKGGAFLVAAQIRNLKR